jgi:DNA replication and repair protein RecF
MRATRITARGFRNLAPLDLELPAEGAVWLGPNGHGKTNLLELLYYPVLFRSLRGARDPDLVRFGETAFHLRLAVSRGSADQVLEVGFDRVTRRKRVAVDGVTVVRIADALSEWLAVAFLPTDIELTAGGGGSRRRFLDRVLALADRSYLRAARRYRAALSQRNAALRQGEGRAALAFEGPLAAAGAELVRERREWVTAYGPRWSAYCAELGEPMAMRLEYRGDPELVDPAAWPDRFARARSRDAAAGTTTAGAHREALALRLDGASLREVGSTGQQRTGALALKLCERATIAERTGIEPTLLLDDAFAELDDDRRDRLAAALGLTREPEGRRSGGAPRGLGQVFLTAPRRADLPARLDLPWFGIREGRVIGDADRAAAG